MASDTHATEHHHAPSAAWLLCAACGPLRADCARTVGISLEKEPGLCFHERCYEVEEPVSFLTLRRWVQEDKALQEAMVQVEAARRKGAAKMRLPSHAEIAGSARAALLLGQGKEFLRFYKEYTQERLYQWHPDPEHTLFWDRVLGPGWAGSAAVPAGKARGDIVLLSASAFAFFPLPPESARGKGICGAPEGYDWLEAAAALRAADDAALASLLEDESAAATAAHEFLCGHLAAAQRAFEELFGRSEDKRYAIVQLYGLPLLLHALVCGVLAGGNPRFLRSWFSTARYALQYIFPPSMEKEEGVLIRFLDHLELVDELVNRGGLPADMPDVDSALCCLPYAMLYSALPSCLRTQLEPETLAEEMRALERDGLTLFARLGAAGLLAADGLRPALRERLAALTRGTEAALPPPPKPAGYRACEALQEAVRKSTRRGLNPYAMPPTMVASRMADSVIIHMMDSEEQQDYDNSAALRCMNKHAVDGLLVLEGASPAEFTHLFTAMQEQVDVVGSLALPGEPVEPAAAKPVLFLSHEGKECFLASLRLRLLPGTRPLMTPGCGLDIPVLERADGSSIAVRRDSAAEWEQVEQAAAALQAAGFRGGEYLAQGKMELSGFAPLVELLTACRACSVECCWEKGRALRLHQPQRGLSLHRGTPSGDWLELGGGLPVDEDRVLELSELLSAFATRSGNTLRLGAEEYVLLTPALERQLALLELVSQEKKGRQGVSTAALPLLDALEERVDPATPSTPAAPSAPATPTSPPRSLHATLRPYQQEGFRWLAERAGMGLGALLADDMGLGKTVQVLALLLHAAEQSGAGPSLVIAPVSLLGNWAEEAARFAPSLTVITFDPQKPAALASAEPGTLVLASYGQIVSRQKDVAALHWDVLVLDEAQAIKNPDSQRAKAVCTLHARARFCLTGTPIENSLLDLWSQMRFLNPGLLGTRAAFQRRFRKSGAAHFELLRQVLAPIVLRRTKADVLTQLPPLTETIVWVDFSREERALYESLRRAAVDKLGQGSSEAAGGIGILAELTRLRRACCHGRLALPGFAGSSSKLAAMVERVEELRAAGRQVLIFSQFTDVLDLAQEALLELGITWLRLDGSTPAAQRSKLVKQFQDGQADAFLISLKAGGAGLNLTAADYVILLDPWWNPAVEAQAAGRSHRMGQARPVTLCRFMVRDTVEERILALHAEKQELAESVLSGSGDGLTLANLRSLLGS